ncbi:MAG: InlB B-repeat-containing protein, partial [Kiritimatiellae bacterium]|nr:InlB B-repeat-containing protein [Kiritimatiellia bacterium]
MRRLLKGLLCLALVLEVKAEVHRYDVTQYPLQTIGTYLELPAEIVGTLSVKDGRQTVAFQTRANYGEVPVAIYTYSGTGAVFKATLVWFHEDFQEPIAVSGTEKRIPIDSVSHYELIIENDQFRSGAQYVVRIGEFEPLTVKFNGNGGELSETQKVYSPGQPYGEFPAVISLLGRRFDGWATAEANGIVLATNTVVCVGYTNLYAQWSDGIDPLEPTKPVPVVTNYVVKFNANGGSGSMTTQTFTYGEAKALSTNLFERSTYDFDGWATSATGKVVYADGEVVSNLTKKINDVVPLYAQWTRATNVYDVAFNANGGLGTMPVQTFYIDQAQALTTNLFIRVGYDFAGWSTSATGTAVYADCQVVSNLDATLDKTLTLYAQWNIKPLQIHSNVVDGITWFFSVDNGTASIINIVGREYGVAVEPQTVASLKVPEILTEGTNDYSVTAIGENAFKGLTLLTEVASPVSVSVISANAFAGCGNIVSATLPMTMPISSVMPDSCKTIKHVKVPGVEEFLDDEVSICEGAFSGCASLESVTLPLGLTELPTSTFDGCSGLVSFEMPYTVTSIGERAFAGCSSLTAITVTENVEEIGANAFTDCSGLKVVRYLGDQPEAETGGANNIYYHSNAALVSGCLPSLRNWPAAASWGEGDASSSTNGVAHEYNPAIWPEGGAGKPLVTWNNKMYQFRTVTLDYNGGSTQKTNHICVAGRVMGVLPEVESDGFVGWFTEKYGGVEVSPYTVVQSSITVFAHWADYGGTRGIVAPFDAFYENDDSFSYAATTFEGVLLKDEKVAGIIQLKTKKGLFVASADGSNSNFTAAMQVLGSKKVTMSGTIGADGSASVEDERKGLAFDLEV